MANKALIERLGLTTEQKALAMLACVAQETKVALERMISDFGLSLLQLNILHALDYAEQGTLTVNQLKAVMLDETPNVSRTLNKLVDMGMVEKKRSSEDQRVVYVSITDKGSQTHRDADQAMQNYQSPLNAEESEQLYQLLKKF